MQISNWRLNFFKKKVSARWGLLLITATAVALRLFRLGKWSFWIDELFTLYNAQNLSLNWSTNLRLFLTEHPVTSMLIQGVTSLLGVNEYTARLAPAMIGIISIPIVFVLGRWLFDTQTALITSLMLAMAPWHLYWSQNTRFYVTLLLFYTIALTFFYVGIEKDNPKYLVLSLLFLGVAVSERLLALFFLPVGVGYLLLLAVLPFEKPAGLNWRNLNIFLFPGLILGLFFGWHFIQNPDLWATLYLVQTDTTPISILLQFVRGIDLHMIIMGGLGAVYLFQKRERIALFLSLSAIIPFLITASASFVQFAHGRYTFVSLTSWLFLAGVAAAKLLDQFTTHSKWLAIGFLAIVTIFVPLQEEVDYYMSLNGARTEWKVAFDYFKNQAASDDQLITNDPTVAAYYLGKRPLGMQDPDLQAVSHLLCQTDQNVWVVVGGESRMAHDLLRWVQENGRMQNINLHKIRIYYIPKDNIVQAANNSTCYQTSK